MFSPNAHSLAPLPFVTSVCVNVNSNDAVPVAGYLTCPVGIPAASVGNL